MRNVFTVFILFIFFLVLPSNFIASCVKDYFIIEGLSVYFLWFLGYIQNNLEYMIQNRIHQADQNFHSVLHSISNLLFLYDAFIFFDV